MHLLDNHQARDRLRWADTTEGSLVQQISTDGRPHESTMDHLDALEAQSIYIFREAFARLKKLALLWSLGKDSNVMIWLARKALSARVPIPALHVDTGKKFPEMYAFRDRYGAEWQLDLKIEPCPPLETIDPTLPPAARSAARKTDGLKLALAKYGFDGLIAGIRRDEEATRAKERVFSPRGTEGGWDVRDQPPEFWDQFNASPPPGAHLRIHPILHWTEADIWAYTQRENIPIIPLYLAKGGKRYRSLGDQDMTVPSAIISATPNGTTRPQVRIVIVGHVDHGKSTLVGRLLHETGSLPEGKLEMLKSVSARRGMPFEWSFLLDALQTERDQGITIDTTQIRFRTRSRDVVLIDAPGHAEFLRNMITGASQADGAVLIIDALEGVRDQTRRHGYLLHLLGIRQVAIVVNKMDRVDFSAARFREISDEISAHLIGLGVTPSAVIPISARDGDGVAARTPRIGWYQGPSGVEALDALEPARPLEQLALRLPVQAIYKFDDRRIVAGRIESGQLSAGDEIVIMPAGKIAKIKTVEGWPVTPVKSAQTAGRSVGITLDRELLL